MQLEGSLIFLCNTSSHICFTEKCGSSIQQQCEGGSLESCVTCIKYIVCTLNLGILDKLTIDELSWHCDFASCKD